MKRFSYVIYHLPLNNFPKNLIFALFLLLTAQCSLITAFAQDNDANRTAPPPLKILSKDEIKQFEAIPDIKKRTKLALDLMEIRLKKAEALNTQAQYAEMFTELGAFHALIDKTLAFLDRNDNGGGKVLNNFKRVEISLRAFLPRIELIRRELPAEYELYVRDLAKAVRQARSRAIEPFFGESVVRDNDK